MALASLHDIRDALLEVKVKAHRLGASGCGEDVDLAIGKHIQALYRQWDDAYEQLSVAAHFVCDHTQEMALCQYCQSNASKHSS